MMLHASGDGRKASCACERLETSSTSQLPVISRCATRWERSIGVSSTEWTETIAPTVSVAINSGVRMMGHPIEGESEREPPGWRVVDMATILHTQHR